MKVFVNLIRLENIPVVYSRHEAGASVYFRHISSCFVFFNSPGLSHLAENSDVVHDKYFQFCFQYNASTSSDFHKRL